MASDEPTRSSRSSTEKKSSRKLQHAKDTNTRKQSKGIDNEDGGASLVEGKENVADDKRKKHSKKRRLQDDRDEKEPGSGGKEEGSHKKKKKRVSLAADAMVQELDNDIGSGDDKTMSEVPVDEQAGDEAETDKKSEKKKTKKKDKGEKKEKKTSVDSNASTGPKIHEPTVLSYLSLYHNHRSTWKFQKNRETHLFKHILSLEQVPVQYNAALLSYLQGLKGEAAKQRLREIAEAAVKADIEETQTDGNIDGAEGSAEQSASAMENYRRAVGAFRTNLSDGKLDGEADEYSQRLDADLTKRLEKRERAEVILFAVDGTLFTYIKPKAPQKGKTTQAQPGKKKKKNRTVVVEISSSSESDSSSDSDDET